MAKITKRKILILTSMVVVTVVFYFLDAKNRERVMFQRQIDFEINLRKISNVEFKESAVLMHKLGFDNLTTQISTSFPVFVTGADSRYFMPMQALIQNLDTILIPAYPNLKLIFYDLGLTTKEAALMRKYCRCCEVRTFPYDKFPSHVRKLKGYAFKPIIINMVFQEFGYVWWLDSSIRFKKSDLSEVLRRVDEDSIWFYSSGSYKFSVPFHTRLETFKYFDEDPEKYMEFQEIQANVLVFRNSNMSRTILKQWVACSLIKDCIDPPGSELRCTDPPKVMTADSIGKCQRFDQSVLNIMLRPLFPYKNEYHMPSCIQLKRHQGSAYFPETLNDTLELKI